ncbi:helix-turn-helix domain-containing protein [Mycobacterium sp. URHB0021]|jgi:DNA-binding IclR family transcriptional regulator
MGGSTSGATTLERGLGLLDQVANGAVRLDDIARAAGLSRSSTHRMLTTLVDTDFLSFGVNHQYRLRIKLLQLGGYAQATIDVSREIQGALEAVSARTLQYLRDSRPALTPLLPARFQSHWGAAPSA